MCRLVGWIGRRPRTLAQVLGPDGLAGYVESSRLHGHGWGAALRDESGRLRLHRSERAARDDPDFPLAASRWAAPAGLVHLRWATPGFGRSLADVHPFTADGWAMTHNGAVSPAQRVDGLLATGSARRPAGSTDSERFFLAVRDELAGCAPVRLPDFVRAVEAISERGAAAGLRTSSLNSMFLGPDGLFVLNWHDPAQVPSIDADDSALPPYYDLRHGLRDGTRVVVLSGFGPTCPGLDLLEPATATAFRADGGARSEKLRPALSLC